MLRWVFDLAEFLETSSHNFPRFLGRVSHGALYHGGCE